MPRPTNKHDLLEAMAIQFDALQIEVSAIAPSDRTITGVCEHWSIKDILGHLDAWHEMFLLWESAGSAGEEIEMPAPGYTWKDTPALNEEIYLRIKDDGYGAVVDRLEHSYTRVRTVLESYADEDLATKRRYRWTGSTSVLSYAVSATSSHYDWARKLIRKFEKTLSPQ
jgi:hypothetical protein